LVGWNGLFQREERGETNSLFKKGNPPKEKDQKSKGSKGNAGGKNGAKEELKNQDGDHLKEAGRPITHFRTS